MYGQYLPKKPDIDCTKEDEPGIEEKLEQLTLMIAALSLRYMPLQGGMQ